MDSLENSRLPRRGQIVPRSRGDDPAPVKEPDIAEPEVEPDRVPDTAVPEPESDPCERPGTSCPVRRGQAPGMVR